MAKTVNAQVRSMFISRCGHYVPSLDTVTSYEHASASLVSSHSDF